MNIRPSTRVRIRGRMNEGLNQDQRIRQKHRDIFRRMKPRTVSGYWTMDSYNGTEDWIIKQIIKGPNPDYNTIVKSIIAVPEDELVDQAVAITRIRDMETGAVDTKFRFCHREDLV